MTANQKLGYLHRHRKEPGKNQTLKRESGHEMGTEKRAGDPKKTYWDRLTVRRKKIQTDPQTGESSFTETEVYVSIPCALSRSNAQAGEQETIASRTSNEYVIFADPEIRLLENDYAIVETEAGEVYEGRTGRTYVAGSHGETVLKIGAGGIVKSFDDLQKAFEKD